MAPCRGLTLPARQGRLSGLARLVLTADGQYGFRSRDDLLQMLKERGEGNKLKLIEQVRAYYLIPGTIVQVIHEEGALGTSQIQLKRLFRPLWDLQ